MHEQVNHPCVQHKLALIRDEDTGYKKFRELATEITMFLCYEALKEIEVKQVVMQEAVRLRVPVSLALAVAHAESLFDPQAPGHLR